MPWDNLTDIHTHVLPGLDDGPESLSQSLDLLQEMKRRGVRRVFCTSHYRSPHFDVEIPQLESAFDALSKVLRQNEDSSLYPEISPGAEIRLTRNLADNLRENSIPTLGDSQYVLVEFPGAEVSNRHLQLLHELRVRGYQPIMAHPERNVAIQKKPSLLDDLEAQGVLFQLTANAFLKTVDTESRESRRLAWSMLETGRVSLIASDSHNTSSRPPVLINAYESIASKHGDEVVGHLMENAEGVVHGTGMKPVQVTRAKRGLFSFLGIRDAKV